jgi:hypothetical protein
VATSGQPHHGPPIYPPPPAPGRKRSVGRIVAIVAGGIIAAVGLFAVLGGLGLLWLDGKKDADGFFTTSAERFSTPRNAITSDDLEIAQDSDASALNTIFGTLRFRVRGSEGRPVFIGIARTAEVNAYLAGVGHERILNVEVDPFTADYVTEEGDVQPEKPGAQDFWDVSAEGPGERTLTWKPKAGNWSIVVMNADGAALVDTRVSAGASVPLITTLAWVALLGGAVVILAGLVLLLGGILWRRRPATP